MGKKDSYRRRALAIAGLIRAYISNAEAVILEIRGKSVSQGIAGRIFAQLKNVSQSYELLVLVKIIKFMAETGIIMDHARDGETNGAGLFFFADAYKNGQDELINRTVALLEEHRLGCEYFFIYLRGIQNFGEAEIAQGIALTPIVPPGSPNAVNVRRWDKERYAVMTSFLGYKKIKALIDRFIADGFDDHEAGHLVWKIIPLQGIGGCNMGEKYIFEVIDMIKSVGLLPSKFANIIFIILEGDHATMSEVREVLGLIKEHNVTAEFDNYAFETMITLNRQPSQRPKMIEMLDQNRPMALSNSYTYAHLLSVLLTDGAGDTSVKMFSGGEVARQARLRTMELLTNRLAELGIFGAEKEMVPRMAANPLLVPDILRVRVSSPTSLDRAKHLAERAYGAEAVRSLLKLSGDSLEAELALAMMRVKPQDLSPMLERIDPIYRISIVRSINWHGYFPTIKAIDVVAASGLEPSFILPMAAELKKKKNPYRWHIPVITTPEIVLATSEQESDLQLFLSWPLEMRKRMGKAIELFSRTYEQIFRRISTGRVSKDILSRYHH